jgi:hypothetical protein
LWEQDSSEPEEKVFQVESSLRQSLGYNPNFKFTFVPDPSSDEFPARKSITETKSGLEKVLQARVDELEQEKLSLLAELAGARQLQTVMLEKMRDELANKMRSRLEVEITDRLTTAMQSQFEV